MSESNPQVGKILDNEYFTNRDRFLELVESIRPNLHRFASRMCGSVVDGEDIVQEALAKAFFKLDELSDVEKLESWMFTITHRKALDLLKARKIPTMLVDEESLASASNFDDVEIQFEVNQAIKTMIVTLPPKERACVVLKEVLGFSLLEIADIVDSTEGGVKAALHRARAKLSGVKQENSSVELQQSQQSLLDNYIDLFNQRDWQGVEQLLKADARLEVVDRGNAIGRDVIKDNYFVNYANWQWNWRLGRALVDGEELVVHYKQLKSGKWQPHAIILFEWSEGQVEKIRDYIHIDYMLIESDVQSLN